MAFRYSPKIVTDGLVLCLDAANNRSYSGTGSSWLDLGGSKNNGNIVKLNVGDPIFNSLNSGSIIFKRVSGTSGDYVSNVNNFNNITDYVTLDCWFKTSISNVQIVAGKGFQGATINQSFMIFLVNNTAYGRITTGGLNSYTDITTTISIGSWVNLTLTYNGSNMILYKNGISSATSSKTGTMSNSFPFLVGAQFNNSSSAITDYFDGNISQVRIYNKALSSSEVLQNYNATKSRFGL